MFLHIPSAGLAFPYHALTSATKKYTSYSRKIGYFIILVRTRKRARYLLGKVPVHTMVLLT